MYVYVYACVYVHVYMPLHINNIIAHNYKYIAIA